LLISSSALQKAEKSGGNAAFFSLALREMWLQSG